jgi:hypothetical protein
MFSSILSKLVFWSLGTRKFIKPLGIRKAVQEVFNHPHILTGNRPTLDPRKGPENILFQKQVQHLFYIPSIFTALIHP